MTVGIGVLAEEGKCVIICSDTRATFPKSNIGPHDECGKQWDLMPFCCATCVAGLLSVAQPLVDELTHQFIKLSSPRRQHIYTEHIANAIDRARYLILRRRVDWAMRTSYGLSLRQWHTGKGPRGKLDPLILKAGEDLIRAEPLHVEMIVGGFLANSQLVFYKASGKRHLEQSTAPGVYVIGTGGQAAMDHLNRRGQNADCSLARSLLHIAEAADAARKANRSTVGKPSHFVIMWKDGGMERFPPECQIIKDWKRAYKNRSSTWSLQNKKVAEVQIQHQMLEHETR